MRSIPCRGPGLVIAAAFLLAASGFAAGRAGTRAGGTVVHVTERDFHISAPTHVRAGDVRLLVDNHGPDAHELIVVRERGSRLPLRRDGVTVNENALERVTAGALEPGSPGSVRVLRLHLAPGRYVLLCNMSGHYLGGMHAQLVVR
jgi:uncharacterized cupredoxin-like copper-binding protein